MAMTFRPPEELAERLRRQAEIDQVSVQTLLVNISEEYLARNSKKEKIDEALDLILVESAEALRRLGE